MSRAILALTLISMTASGQVVVNGGRTFLGPLDATNATRTQPFRMGSAASRPPVCVQGEVYFQTDAVAGQNLQFCTAANVWTAMAGGEGGGSGSGNMVNSGASMVNALPRYTDTGGTALAPSSVTVDGGGNLAAPGSVTTGGAASGSVALSGAASGGAKITVAAAAGAPADLVLPTQTGLAGQVLQTNGGSPQQLSWVTQGGEATSVVNSGASGAAVLKAGTNVTARKLVAGANVSITENADHITIEASGGGGGGSVAEIAANGPGMWFPFGYPQTQLAGGAQVALRTYIAEFVLPVRITLDTIGFRVHTAASAADAGLTVGIYSSTCGALLTSGNKAAGLNVAGYHSVPVASTVLNPGVYYMAWTTDNTALQMSGAGISGVTNGFSGMAGALTTFFGTVSTGSGPTIALPVSCGTRSAPGAVSVPHFALIP